MTSKFDLSAGLIFYSEFQQIKNDSSVTGSLSIPASSYAAGQGKTFSLTIPIVSAGQLIQLYANMSTSSGDWHNVPFNSVSIGTDWFIQTGYKVTGSSIIVHMIINNSYGAVRTSPAVTVSARANTFVTPF